MARAALRRALAAMALTVSAAGVAAQDYVQLPALARVANIAADDVLNIRAGASADSADIGDLSLGEPVEVIAYNDDASWARIIVGDGNGWVAARYLDAVQRPLSNGGLPLGLSCAGTEPFWSAQIETDETVTFSIADREDTQSIPLDWSGTSQNIGPGAYGFSGAGATGVLRRAQCSDGMSDRDYGWAIDMILTGDAGTQLYSGCCIGN